MSTNTASAGALIRDWRGRRRLSQLALAGLAGTSTVADVLLLGARSAR